MGMIYKHYKMKKYNLLHISEHTETGESIVIYNALDNPRKIWARPALMFFGLVKVKGKLVPRFSNTETWISK